MANNRTEHSTAREVLVATLRSHITNFIYSHLRLSTVAPNHHRGKLREFEGLKDTKERTIRIVPRGPRNRRRWKICSRRLAARARRLRTRLAFTSGRGEVQDDSGG